MIYIGSFGGFVSHPAILVNFHGVTISETKATFFRKDCLGGKYCLVGCLVVLLCVGARVILSVCLLLDMLLKLQSKQPVMQILLCAAILSSLCKKLNCPNFVISRKKTKKHLIGNKITNRFFLQFSFPFLLATRCWLCC